jgi:hypothetical protein
MAIVLNGETGFVMTEQLPCLKLNARSITPENDVAKRLYKPCAEWGVMCANKAGKCSSPLRVSKSVALVGIVLRTCRKECHRKHR